MLMMRRQQLLLFLLLTVSTLGVPRRQPGWSNVACRPSTATCPIVCSDLINAIASSSVCGLPDLPTDRSIDRCDWTPHVEERPDHTQRQTLKNTGTYTSQSLTQFVVVDMVQYIYYTAAAVVPPAAAAVAAQNSARRSLSWLQSVT